MPESISIRLEKPVPGFTPNIEFSAFGLNWEAIERAAQKLDLLSPYDFISESPDEYEEMMEGVKELEAEFDKTDIEQIKDSPELKELLKEMETNPQFQQLKDAIQKANSPDELLEEIFPSEPPEEEWCDAQEGLDFLNAIAEHIKKEPKNFKKTETLTAELQEMLKTLKSAKQSAVKFYLTMEYD